MTESAPNKKGTLRYFANVIAKTAGRLIIEGEIPEMIF